MTKPPGKSMPSGSPARPNIVLINCDDLGYGDLGCYGSELNRTPALDRLAGEGMKFTDFYMASSICSPSRAGMLTGCNPQRLSIQRVFFPADPEGLNPEEETIAGMLKGAGYRTALVGKWHLGDQQEFLPSRFGFDRYYGLPYSNDMGRQAGRDGQRLADQPRLHAAGDPPLPLMLGDEVIEEQPDQSGLTARYVEESIRFLRESHAAGDPFFLYFAHMYVHVPLYVPEPFLKASRNGPYGGAVACIDWAWARIDDELRRLGISDNTIVLFTSDNGSRANGEGGSNAPLKGAKFSTWEGGFRVPLIARWPGRIPEGRQCCELASALDFRATLAGFAGVSRSVDGVDGDGFDLGPLLLGATGPSPRKAFPYYSQGGLAAIRMDNWKIHFVRPELGGAFEPVRELYDLRADPGESANLFDNHPDVVTALIREADGVRAVLGDRFTGVRGSGIRPCGRVENPVPLSTYRESACYFQAEYDLPDRG